MAIIVETGVGVVDATSYVGVADADTYFARFNNTVWSGKTTQQKETALVQASFYADTRWGARIKGLPVNSEQGLALPVKGLHAPTGAAITGVPRNWCNAVCEYALASTKGSLFLDNSTATNSSKIKKKRVTVGPITTSTEFADPFAGTSNFLPFPIADNLVKNAIASSGSSGGAIR